MATFGEAIIKFVGDMTGLSKTGQAAGEEAGKTTGEGMTKGFGTLVSGVAAAWTGAAITGFAKNALDAGQDLQAAMSRSQAVFGSNAKEVQEWSDTTTQSMGIAGSESLKMANTLGNVLVNSMGMSQEGATKMSESVVKTSADIAAFAKVPVGTAVDAVTRAMEGQTRGLKSLGISISAAQVKQQAQTMGLYDGKGALDQAAQAEATYALIMQKSTASRGYAAKSLQTYAGQQRLMSAELQDVQEELGTAMLPILTRMAELFNSVLAPALQRFTEFARQNQGVMTAVGAVLAVVVGGAAALVPIATAVSAAITVWTAAVAAWGVVTKAATAIQAAFDVVMDADPIVLIVIAIILLIGAIAALYIKWAPFRDLVNDTGQAIAHFAQTAIADVGGFFSMLGTWVQGALGAVVGFVTQFGQYFLLLLGPLGILIFAIVELVQHWGEVTAAVGGMVTAVLGFLGGLVSGLIGILASIGGWVVSVVLYFNNLEVQVLNYVLTLVLQILLQLANLYSQALLWIQTLVLGVVSWFQNLNAQIAGAMATLVATVVAWLSSALGQAIGLATQIATAIGGAFSGVVGTVSAAISGVVNAIVGGLSGAIGQAEQLGQEIVQGLVSGIQSIASQVGSTLSNIATSALNAAKQAVSGSPPMYSLGVEMMQGWAQGLTDNAYLPINATAAAAQASMGIGSTSVSGGAAGALAGAAGARGPALVINQATFNDEADLTSLSKKMEFAVQAGSF